MFSALRILTQIIKSWLVITLQLNNRVVLFVLNSLFPSKGGEGHKEFKEINTTRLFHFKVITSQALRICVKIRNALSTDLANMDCECFSITHSFIFYHVIISNFVFYSIYFTVSYRLYQSNSVTWSCISFNLVIPFFE